MGSGSSPAGTRRIATMLVAAFMAVPAVLASSSDVAAAGESGSATAPPTAASAPTAAGPAAAIPCPKTKAPKVHRPPRPSPPPDVPEDRIIGGQQLGTSGLVIPDGVAKPPKVTATSWLVADLDTGAVLGACGPHEYATPASVQKLLLVATMLPRLDPRKTVTVTREDLNIEPGSSAVGLVEDGHYTIETIWLGLLLQSGNDAANTLARLGSRTNSAADGVRMMNVEAQYLGAMQTHAVTPSGLDGHGQFTSAYDLALIARLCFTYPDFRRYALTERTRIPAQPPRYESFEVQNENRLIFEYPGALGGKTGFTDLARHTYVGAAERNGRRLVVTLLGAERRPAQGWEQGARLLDWGFALPEDSSVGRLVEPGEVLASRAPSPSPAATSALAAARTPLTGSDSTSGQGWTDLPTITLLVAAAAVALVLVVRAQRRRAAQRESPDSPFL